MIYLIALIFGILNGLWRWSDGTKDIRERINREPAATYARLPWSNVWGSLIPGLAFGAAIALKGHENLILTDSLMLIPLALIIWSNLAAPGGWGKFLANKSGMGSLLRYVCPFLIASFVVMWTHSPLGACLIGIYGILAAMVGAYGERVSSGFLLQVVHPALAGLPVAGLVLL